MQEMVPPTVFGSSHLPHQDNPPPQACLDLNKLKVIPVTRARSHSLLEVITYSTLRWGWALLPLKMQTL